MFKLDIIDLLLYIGVTMAATAKQNFIVKPTLGVDYSRKVRQRTLQAAQPKRGIKIIGDNENRGAYVPPGASAAAIAKFGNLVVRIILIAE